MKARPTPPKRPVPPPPPVPARPVPQAPPSGRIDSPDGPNQARDAEKKRPVPPFPPRRPSSDAAEFSDREGATANAIGVPDKTRLLARRPPPRPVPPLPKRLPSVQESIPVSSNEILPVPPPPPRPPNRPPLPARKRTEDESREDGHNLSNGSQTAPETPGRRRLPPQPAANAKPILPPPVNLATKPVVELRLPEPSSEGACLKCYDFTDVDEHAALFPRHTVTSLPALARDLTAPFDTETEKARAIFAWLSYNVLYDVQAFMSGNLQHATPESTLHSGLAVCDGYAGLFMHLAQLAGMRQVTKVTGHGKGYGYSALPPGVRPPPPESNHAWNRIYLDGEWRLIDACWGAGALVGGVWDQRLNPYWFTADAGEFGTRHFPMDDPKNQCLPGRPLGWEEYITEPERPQAYGEFQRLNFDAFRMEPEWNGIPTGQRLSFRVVKRCVHMSMDAEDNYVLVLTTSDNTRTPMVPDGRGGWSATIYVPHGSDVTLYYVSMVDDQDAKGLTVEEYQWFCGRKGMMTQGLAKWTAASSQKSI